MKGGNARKIAALLEMVSNVDHYFITLSKDYHGLDVTQSITGSFGFHANFFIISTLSHLSSQKDPVTIFFNSGTLPRHIANL